MKSKYSVNDKYEFPVYDPDQPDLMEVLTVRQILGLVFFKIYNYAVARDKLHLANAEAAIDDYILINYGTRVKE